MATRFFLIFSLIWMDNNFDYRSTRGVYIDKFLLDDKMFVVCLNEVDYPREMVVNK